MGKRRSSFQLEQEKKSRLQLEERLSDFGWHLTSPSPDLGEDFIVEIYDEGENTGVNFYIQIKSVTNLEARKSKTTEHLVYTLKMKDLKHWESFSLPVVICIWDVNIRDGRWAFVRDLILHLNQINPKWRKNKKDVQVYIPWINTTKDDRLKRLKAEIGRYVYPLISSGKDLLVNMKLNFPDTPEGKKLWKAFDLHMKEGEPVTLTGDVIQEVKVSDWWEMWFGKVNPLEAEIHIDEVSSQNNIPISFKVIPQKGKTIGLSSLEFRLVRAGTELMKFNNAHTSHPILLNFDLRKAGDSIQINLSYMLRHSGGEPYEILNFLDFAKAMANSGKLQITFLDTEKSFTSDTAGFPTTSNTGIEPAFYDLVQKLCFIQDKIGQFFRIPKEGILAEDADLISKLFEILECGTNNYANATAALEVKGKGLQLLLDVHKQGKPIHFILTTSDTIFELFGTEISLGPMTRDVTGFIKMDPLELETIITKLNPEEFLKITLVNANGSDTFANWCSSANQET